MSEFTHLDAAGAARMVDVTAKTPTVRAAIEIVAAVIKVKIKLIVLIGIPFS